MKKTSFIRNVSAQSLVKKNLNIPLFGLEMFSRSHKKYLLALLCARTPCTNKGLFRYLNFCSADLRAFSKYFFLFVKKYPGWLGETGISFNQELYIELMAKFDHEFNLNTCLPINVAEKYMNGPQLVGTWFSESICFKYLSSFSPQPIRSVRDQTFSTRELFIRPLHLILFHIS